MAKKPNPGPQALKEDAAAIVSCAESLAASLPGCLGWSTADDPKVFLKAADDYEQLDTLFRRFGFSLIPGPSAKNASLATDLQKSVAHLRRDCAALNVQPRRKFEETHAVANEWLEGSCRRTLDNFYLCDGGGLTAFWVSIELLRQHIEPA